MCPNIYAVGDVTDRINLTPVAIAEGRAIAETLYNNNPIRMDHADVPSAVFSQPPIGAVGLTEEEARRRYGEVDIYSARFKPMKNTLSGRDERTLMKLVVDARSDRVLGCHMLGPDAPEIIQGLAIAVKCGASKRSSTRPSASTRAPPRNSSRCAKRSCARQSWRRSRRGSPCERRASAHSACRWRSAEYAANCA